MESSKIRLLVIGAVIVIIALLLLVSSCSIVKPGERGVLVKMGAVDKIALNEGLHFKAPFFHKIVPMSVRIQKVETPGAAVSKDLQDINTVIALNYHILPDRVPQVYKDYAKSPQEAEAIIINPKVQEIVKAIISKYNTLELISQREKIRSEIYEKLRAIVIRYNIVLDELSIVNFAFSSGFQASIERKQIAEQDAITAQKKLEQIKFEAEQKIAEARGESESNKLKQLTLTPMLIEWEAVKKWNGVLPTVTGNGIPLINLK